MADSLETLAPALQHGLHSAQQQMLKPPTIKWIFLPSTISSTGSSSPFCQSDFLCLLHPSLITRVILDSRGDRQSVCVCVCEESGPVTHLLGKGLLQSGQGGVGVGGVRLQGLDSLLQAAHLLFLISKLLLEVFNLSCE